MEDAPLVVVPDFFAEADALRHGFDRLVATPHAQDIVRDGVWNYWYVPGLYTYLRAEPARVLPTVALERLRRRLASWALHGFGFSHVSGITLSMYVDGCEQQLHNDAGNGDYAFVYSLTRWEERHFEGGETIVFQGGTTAIRGRPGTGESFYEKVPARFNQLVVFDDRLLHGVARVTGGGMSPLDSRLVLHGHLSARDIVVSEATVGARQAIDASLQKLASRLFDLERARAARYQGFFTLRMTVRPNGTLGRLTPLLFRVALHDGSPIPRERVLEEFAAALKGVSFPRTDSGAVVTIPVAFVAAWLADPARPRDAKTQREIISTATPTPIPRGLIPSSQRRVPFIPQTDAGDCGAAALAMVVAYHGKKATLSDVREACDVAPSHALSAKNILVAARAFGLMPRARRLDSAALASLVAPAILHWDQSHFVVLERWTPKGAVIVDPRVGPCFIGKKELAARLGAVSIEVLTRRAGG